MSHKRKHLYCTASKDQNISSLKEAPLLTTSLHIKPFHQILLDNPVNLNSLPHVTEEKEYCNATKKDILMLLSVRCRQLIESLCK